MLSLPTRAYYLVKPVVPHAVAVALRRWLGRRKRVSNASTWPIDPRSGGTPPGWPGWPGGKQFAFVLTHDIEGPIGIGRVRQLLEVEQRHGVRASYNFVPGDGEVPAELRQAVSDAGGEVGVHGLEHDGKLFFSKEVFEQKAVRIRQYLRDWKACGFRAPFMHHKLSWIHKLGSEYDSSTFDTDPFEPQPDGVRTIFPFWVPEPGSPDPAAGYVELPYTLVQDFTLFRILGDTDIEVWKKKLDWVAARGGIALLDTHPDYMHFGEGAPASDTEYPVRLYEEFLSYARQKYGDVYWHALPREVARHYKESLPRPESRNTRKRICMVTASEYTSGSPIRRYAEALARRGDLVDVIAAGDTASEQTMDGVHLLTEPRGAGFAWRAGRRLTRMHNRILYDCVHVRDTGGVLGLAAYGAKLGGAKVILDRREWTAGTSNSSGFWAGLAVSLLDAHVIVAAKQQQQQQQQQSDGGTSGIEEASYPALVDTLAALRDV